MKTLLLFAFFSLLATGCHALTCTAEYRGIQVRVVDTDGNPVAGATVTSTNLDSGEIDTRTTSFDGSFTLGEAVGGGRVKTVATLGSRTSTEKETRWSCDRCHCDIDHDLDPGDLVMP